MRPKYELAQIIRDYGDGFVQKHTVLKQHQRTLHALRICRTAALGGHVERCNNETCAHERIAYNSCRNRHCPKCQTTNRERWILNRKKDLLPCTYFHVVFTLPHELNSYCLKYPRELYNILFQASKDTLFVFAKDAKHLGAQMGAISVLHTWGQNLSLHPHVHMIVPGGGFTQQNTWKTAASDGSFLFPIRAMAMVYRGKFMEQLLTFLNTKQIPLDKVLRRKLYNKNWVIYAKQPFKGPEGVIEYLGRYSHKIAISNHRIKKIESLSTSNGQAGGKVTFSYKDYAHGSVTKQMQLEAGEFLRRFCMHILPPRFVKMRHYGFLASRNKKKLRIEQMRQGVLPVLQKQKAEKPDYKAIIKQSLGYDIGQCPCCKKGKMEIIYQFGPNAPPIKINDLRNKHKNSNL